jgi:hypothetical protein
VLVDGHPICHVCGRAVAQVAPERWAHARRGAGRPRINAAALRAAGSYEAFRERFPSLSHASEGDWREALRRLETYEASVAAGRSYGEIHAQLLAPGLTPVIAQILDLAERRRELATRYAWAIPNEAALEALGRHAPLVECGAGTGYWSALLRSRGVDVAAYDLAPSRRAWTALERADSVAAARRHRDRALVLCWPPYDDDRASYDVVRAYRGEMLIHIGERGEGTTGSVRFHRELALNWTLVEEVDLPHWPRLRDSLCVYRRNAERQALIERDRCFECGRFIATGAIGRCDACFERRPPALALRAGRHRVEYPREVVDAMPPALRKAFEASPNRIR